MVAPRNLPPCSGPGRAGKPLDANWAGKFLPVPLNPCNRNLQRRLRGPTLVRITTDPPNRGLSEKQSTCVQKPMACDPPGPAVDCAYAWTCSVLFCSAATPFLIVRLANLSVWHPLPLLLMKRPIPKHGAATDTGGREHLAPPGL